MSDLLDRGLAWLAGKRHDHMTREVEYQRGSDIITISATRGRSRFEQADESGMSMESKSVDWIVRASDLVFVGRVVEPERGHKVHWTDAAGNRHTYELLSDNGLPVFSYADGSRRTIRVHTKHVKTEVAA